MQKCKKQKCKKQRNNDANNPNKCDENITDYGTDFEIFHF